VARDVDERGGERAAGQVAPRVAELDGQPAALLLLEAVRVGARERVDQRRLAVVDVTGGDEDALVGQEGTTRARASATRSAS
jgi:hypothetical protein